MIQQVLSLWYLLGAGYDIVIPVRKHINPGYFEKPLRIFKIQMLSLAGRIISTRVKNVLGLPRSLDVSNVAPK